MIVGFKPDTLRKKYSFKGVDYRLLTMQTNSKEEDIEEVHF